MAKILIIEDELSYCDSLEIILSRAGHEVFIAWSCHQGIQEGIDCAPDLLIVDWMLKGDLNGGQEAKQILAVHPQVKVIVVTKYTDVARQVGESYNFIDKVLQKPYHTADIIAAAEQTLAVR
ncbi:MAG: response regulator [Pirellulales bacterium]